MGNHGYAEVEVFSDISLKLEQSEHKSRNKREKNISKQGARTRLEMDQWSDPMGIESISCKTKHDCELKVVLQEVFLRITMNHNDGNEKDQNIRKAQSK